MTSFMGTTRYIITLSIGGLETSYTVKEVDELHAKSVAVRMFCNESGVTTPALELERITSVVSCVKFRVIK